MDKSAVRFVPELRDRASKEAAAAAHAKKTDKLEHFIEAYRLREKSSDKKDAAAKMKRKKGTLLVSTWKQRTFELENICEVLTADSVSPEDVSFCRQRAQFLGMNIDLFTPHPDAFMENSGQRPRPPNKSQFWPKLQDTLGAEKGLFRVWGYPQLHGAAREGEEILNYAIDLMAAVHSPVDFDQSLTVHLHAKRCAAMAVRPVIKNNYRMLSRLDLHCDYPPWVVLQKSGTQQARDARRNESSSLVDSTGAQRDLFPFNLSDAPARDWGSMISNRQFKEGLTVAIGVEAFIEAAKCVYDLDCRAEVWLCGINLEVSPMACNCSNPDDLGITIVQTTDGRPVALIYNAYDEEVECLMSACIEKFDAGKVWQVSLRYAESDISRTKEKDRYLCFEKIAGMESRHGEAETRIQRLLYTQFLYSISAESPSDVYTMVQDTTDSDNLCLALISHLITGAKAPRRTFIKGRGNYYDITVLMEAIRSSGLELLAIVRLSVCAVMILTMAHTMQP